MKELWKYKESVWAYADFLRKEIPKLLQQLPVKEGSHKTIHFVRYELKAGNG